MSDAVRIDSSISFHLSKLSNTKVSILYDISLARDWKRKSWLITPGSERLKPLHFITRRGWYNLCGGSVARWRHTFHAYHILLLRQPVLLSLCWLCCFLFFRNLIPVTQLYVSVDASSKESLKKIDRPLFKDYWPRFLDSLKALSDKVNRPLSRIGQFL